MPRMLGHHCPDGPGGRDCYCCGQPPGQERKAARRRVKRSERQQWKHSLHIRTI
jgi:hypothetical protein